MSTQVRINDAFYSEAKSQAKVELRSIPNQIEYWAKIGKTAIENPETLQEASDAIELDCQIKGDAQLEVSKGLLEVVIHNLLDNFKKHIEGAFVTIKIEQTDDEVIIKFLQAQPIVYDKVETVRMFQPFWTTSKSGLGLGLFITRSSLKKIGGSITFISENTAQGFEIVLPNQAVFPCRGKVTS